MVKLGFSWEAMDVRKWTGKEELARHMSGLLQQANGTAPAVMVQVSCFCIAVGETEGFLDRTGWNSAVS